jgi:hypothetical protein
MSRAKTRVSPSRGVVLTLGVVYLALSVIGFATVGWHEFGMEKPVRMLGFLGVSTLLNVVHLLVGAVLTAAALRRFASGIAPVALVAFTAMTVFGLVARIFGGMGDPLNLNWWNVGLYALSALACGYAYVRAATRE